MHVNLLASTPPMSMLDMETSSVCPSESVSVANVSPKSKKRKHDDEPESTPRTNSRPPQGHAPAYLSTIASGSQRVNGSGSGSTSGSRSETVNGSTNNNTPANDSESASSIHSSDEDSSGDDSSSDDSSGDDESEAETASARDSMDLREIQAFTAIPSLATTLCYPYQHPPIHRILRRPIRMDRWYSDAVKMSWHHWMAGRRGMAYRYSDIGRIEETNEGMQAPYTCHHCEVNDLECKVFVEGVQDPDDMAEAYACSRCRASSRVCELFGSAEKLKQADAIAQIANLKSIVEQLRIRAKNDKGRIMILQRLEDENAALRLQGSKDLYRNRIGSDVEAENQILREASQASQGQAQESDEVEVEGLESQIRDLVHQNHKVSDHNEELVRKVRELVELVDREQAQYEEAKDWNHTLSNENMLMRERADRYQSLNDSLTAENEKHVAEIKQLRADAVCLKEGGLRVVEEMARLKATTDPLIAENEKLVKEMRQMTSPSDPWSENEKLVVEMDELKGQVGALTACKERLVEEIRRIGVEGEDYAEHREAFIVTVHALTKELDEREKKVEALKNDLIMQEYEQRQKIEDVVAAAEKTKSQIVADAEKIETRNNGIFTSALAILADLRTAHDAFKMKKMGKTIAAAEKLFNVQRAPAAKVAVAKSRGSKAIGEVV